MNSIVARCIQTLVIAGLLAVALPAVVEAQTTPAAQDGIAAMPKGTIGLGLIGAELGMAVPAIFGMKDIWPYLLFPAIGAGGGVTLGILWLDKDGANSKVSVAMLAVGTALVIPTLVLTLTRSAYDPEDEGGTELNEDLNVQAAREAGPGLENGGSVGVVQRRPSVGGSAGDLQLSPERAHLLQQDLGAVGRIQFLEHDLFDRVLIQRQQVEGQQVHERPQVQIAVEQIPAEASAGQACKGRLAHSLMQGLLEPYVIGRLAGRASFREALEPGQPVRSVPDLPPNTGSTQPPNQQVVATVRQALVLDHQGHTRRRIDLGPVGVILGVVARFQMGHGDKTLIVFPFQQMFAHEPITFLEDVQKLHRPWKHHQVGQRKHGYNVV